MNRRRWLAAAVLIPPAAAYAAEAPSGVLNLSASASVEVVNDLLTVVLSATREGADPGSVQGALKQALDAALAEAKRAAKPEQVDVHTGSFSLYPRHAPKGGGITGWQGSAELVIEGRDMNAIAQLSGRITTMTIARLGHSLSREQRRKVEGEVAAQAIARYREKAAEYAKQFGYASVVMREVHVSSSDPPGLVPMAMARAKTMEAADAALPVEPGKGTVTVTVSGTVQMLK
jgi:predicted secreted protein